MRCRLALLALLTLVGLVLSSTACADDGDDRSSPPTAGEGASEGEGAEAAEAPGAAGGADPEAVEGPAGSLTISAASSLTEAFDQLATNFNAEHPGVELTLNFDSSSTLAAQILEGAPADVYASADEADMARLADDELLGGDPVVFAANDLVMVTKPGNPEGIDELADLAETGVIALCGEDVPCGRFAGEALGGAGVTIPESSITRGQNVKATLTAVSEGDAVAGIVYATDALAAGSSVSMVDLPAEVQVTARYPIATLAATDDPELAGEFVDYVTSDEGEAILVGFGFLPPP